MCLMLSSSLTVSTPKMAIPFLQQEVSVSQEFYLTVSELVGVRRTLMKTV